HKSSSAELKNDLEKVFAKITEAYEKLKDSDQRKIYDEKIRGKAESSPQPPPPQTQISRPAPQAPVASTTSPPQATSRPVTASATSIPTPATNAKGNKPPNVAEATFAQGKMAYDRGDFVRAAYLLRESVSNSPENKQYRQLLVQTLMRNPKWFKEAEDHLTDLIQDEPMNATYHLMLGQIYKEGGMKTRAASKFKEALSIDPVNRKAIKELKALQAEGGLEGGKGAGLKAKFEALPKNLQYGILIALLLLIVLILYTQL
ncbi:MAG: hypothetical protein JNN15_20350, partial [Blastocatellia bacterium]|nr:hypothetical protein [Blastocatellia bacterium]